MQTETKDAPAAANRKILSPIKAGASAKASLQAAKDAPAKPAAIAGQRPQAATTLPKEPTPPVPAQPASDAAAAPVPSVSPAAATWSSEDESGFQAMLARRKASGYQRRGRDVGAQLICVGEITPNAGTVAAAIVHLVAERGTVTRGHLLDAMAKTAFPHAKARPEDREWCQGYVAGALRDCFLTLSDGPSPSEKSAETPR